MAQVNADSDAEPAEPKPEHSGWMVWVVFGIVLIGVGVLGIINQVGLKRQAAEVAQQGDCIAQYVNGATRLSKDRDDATQRLWIDLRAAEKYTLAKNKRAAIVHINNTILQDNPLPEDADIQAVSDALNHLFFTDLSAEIDANTALAKYREDHVPKEECPQ